MRLLMLATSLCLVLGSATAGAAQADEAGQVVSINGVRNPELRSYRSVVAGLDAFDKHHGFAPMAPEVRFRMLPKRNTPALAEPLAIRIVGEGDAIPLPIGADGTFAVPRVQAAWDSDADLVLNQKKGLFRGVPVVRTPGLPDNVVRLGDIRLQCRVNVAIIKSEVSFWVIAAANTLLMTSDWCSKEGITWGTASTVRVAGATLVHADRKLDLATTAWEYKAPIGDVSWPDDARIELSVDDPAGGKKVDAMPPQAKSADL